MSGFEAFQTTTVALFLASFPLILTQPGFQRRPAAHVHVPVVRFNLRRGGSRGRWDNLITVTSLEFAAVCWRVIVSNGQV